MPRCLSAAALAALTGALAMPASADPVDDALAGRIGAGTLSEARTALAGLVGASPDDDRARLALGVVEAFLAGELLVQRAYAHAFGEPLREAGMTFLPALGAMPYNSSPTPAPPDTISRICLEVRGRLAAADRTLADVDDPEVKLRLDLATFNFDINADGRISRDETATSLFRDLVFAGQIPPEGDSFELALDRADAEWLRAYCHLLMGLTGAVGAHDWSPLMQRAGHVLFAEVESDYPFLAESGPFDFTDSGLDFSDLIALVHLINVPVADPALMREAHANLVSASDHALRMWDLVEQETDNDREWLPGPQQGGAIRGVQITPERLTAWRAAAADAREILEGRQLIRFWRGDGEQGINLRRVFHEPTAFDLVLWIQGSAAKPYLEDGPLVREDFWTALESAFGQDLLGYLFYIN